MNVAVTQQIAPRVSSDGPNISQREAETSATVHDGETFVIGGLTEENDLSTDSKAPGIGDVPLAGELFKVRKSTKSKTELYIVVTPHVVRASDAQTAALLRDDGRLR